MAKRFIDTDIFDDPWFMDLSKDGKITWLFLITKCDHAGIIQINERLFKVMTGINSLATVLKELGNRIVPLRDNYFFIPKFIFFQYPEFPKSKVNQQAGAIKRLLEFGLFDLETLKLNEVLMNSSTTLDQDLPKSYGNDNVYVNDNVFIEKGVIGGKTKSKPDEEKTWRNDFDIFSSQIWTAFDQISRDTAWIADQERLNPTLDILLSIEKSIKNFWGTPDGWKNKKKTKTETPDWKQTFAKTMQFNKVYKPKNSARPISGPTDPRYQDTNFDDIKL